MQKFFYSAAMAFSLIASTGFANDTSVNNPVIGVVNFASCLTESKVGRKEQENMESIRKQMSSLIEDTEKELKELTAKFDDTEYLDSLSPKAEEELKVKFQTLQEDLGRYQNQFYQVLQHANYQMMHKMSGTIAKAAEKIAKSNKLDYVINKEVCFYIRPDLDVTTSVITEMDNNFELDTKASKKLSDNSEDLPQLDNAQEMILETASEKAG